MASDDAIEGAKTTFGKDRPGSDFIPSSNDSWLHRWIYWSAYPWYDCEDCTGTGQGCYCDFHDAVAPGRGPTRWHLFLRWVWNHRGLL